MNKATTVRYVSKYLALKIVRKPSYNKEVDGRVIAVTGESIRFIDGLFETSDPAVIEFLDQRPEAGKIFVRVPDDVSSLVARQEAMKSLEAREAEVAKREAALANKEAKLSASEEGQDLSNNLAVTDDGLENLKRGELIKLAETEGMDINEFKRPGVKNIEIVEAIREYRAANATLGSTGEKPAAY